MSMGDYDLDAGDYETDITCQLMESEAGEEFRTLLCNGTMFTVPEQPLTYLSPYFWMFIFLYIFLMLMSGVFSGLVLGLLSLDLTILKVLKNAGTPTVRAYASRITPLVENHHLLLVTLLLANAICMESMPLCIDRVSNPLAALLISVTTVLIFGEVVPQAVCSRYGLAIGAKLTPLVYCLIALLFVVAYPIAKLLDCLLGKGHGTFYRRAELKALVSLHGDITHHRGPQHQELLTKDEIMVIQGALDMKDKTAFNAMIPLNDVFMLSIDTCLNEDTLIKIQKSFVSRIPIYEHCRTNIRGILMVKCLIRFNPKDAGSIRRLMDTRAVRKPHFVTDDTCLFDVLNHFQTGRSHLSVVTKTIVSGRFDFDRTAEKNCHCALNQVLGIITLEDIIEELLQKEIRTETEQLQGSLSSVLHMALSRMSWKQGFQTSSSSPAMFFEDRELLRSYYEEREPLQTPSFAISMMESIEEGNDL